MIRQLPEWAIGPFYKYSGNPILSPAEHGFDDWAVYNGAVAVKDGVFYLFYRAETRAEADTPYMGTSRIGLATSQDGFNFTRVSDQPVIDATEDYELPGGCEDPRIVKVGETWHLLYTAYAYPDQVSICDAVSTDLVNWEKRGPVLARESAAGISSKSCCVVCNPAGEAVRIDGSYVMYCNEFLARSQDFQDWQAEPFEAQAFAGEFVEVCVAVTDYAVPGKDDIVVFIAGDLNKINPDGDYFYALTEALYSRQDPRMKMDHLAVPILAAEYDYEKSTDRLPFEKAAKGTLFMDSLLRYQDKWWLYYGAADQYMALAEAGGTI
jgi:predicted GH43/DUF377 family glycosyl hydrolase